MNIKVKLAVLAAAVVVVGAVTVGGLALSANASNETGNPWIYTMTGDSQEGMVIEGASGPNGNIFLVKDHLNQPIFSILKAGGAAVIGDQFRVMDGSDIINGQITISPDGPNPAVCVRTGQLWIGGPSGEIWRCGPNATGELQWVSMLLQ